MRNRSKNLLNWLGLTASFLILNFPLLNAQPYKLKGKVVDTLRRPLEGILVCVKSNKTVYKTSNAIGKFSIKVQENDTLLMLSPEDEIFQIAVNGRKEMTFILKSTGKTIELDNNTYRILHGVENEILKKYLISLKPKEPEIFYATIYDMIRQEYPDLEVNDGSGTISIRRTGYPALIVVDGVKVRSLGFIDPNDVKSIKVIKDGTAGIYGGRAAGGVIEIKTKTGKK